MLLPWWLTLYPDPQPGDVLTALDFDDEVDMTVDVDDGGTVDLSYEVLQ